MLVPNPDNLHIIIIMLVYIVLKRRQRNSFTYILLLPIIVIILLLYSLLFEEYYVIIFITMNEKIGRKIYTRIGTYRYVKTVNETSSVMITWPFSYVSGRYLRILCTYLTRNIMSEKKIKPKLFSHNIMRTYMHILYALYVSYRASFINYNFFFEIARSASCIA